LYFRGRQRGFRACACILRLRLNVLWMLSVSVLFICLFLKGTHSAPACILYSVYCMVLCMCKHDVVCALLQNWISHGYDFYNRDDDEWAHHMMMLTFITVPTVFFMLFIFYYPDHQSVSVCLLSLVLAYIVTYIEVRQHCRLRQTLHSYEVWWTLLQSCWSSCLELFTCQH